MYKLTETFKTQLSNQGLNGDESLMAQYCVILLNSCELQYLCDNNTMHSRAVVTELP